VSRENLKTGGKGRKASQLRVKKLIKLRKRVTLPEGVQNWMISGNREIGKWKERG